MRWRKQYGIYLVVAGLLLELADGGMAESRPKFDVIYASTLGVAIDASRNFDFELGTWDSHTWCREKPLTGSSSWNQYDGIEMVRSVANGAANLLEFHADGPAGHLEGLSLRFYDSSAQRWTLYYSNAAAGVALIPASGVFKNGQWEFYDQETYDGKAIMVRSVWSGDTPNAHYFERSFSADDGMTWEVNWITTFTRQQDATHQAHRTSRADLQNVAP